MKRVMIYDDDPDLLNVCKLILELKNFEVAGRETCSAILEDLKQYHPDVILMDNRIPDVGGVKATRLIKESNEFGHIPVIFFSAHNDIVELAAEAGADYALQKPFDMDELEKMVSAAAGILMT